MKNVLRFPADNIEVPFLSDEELKEHCLRFFPNLPSAPSSSPQEEAERERRIKTMMTMGASRSQAEDLLRTSDWNIGMAGAMLFQTKLIRAVLPLRALPPLPEKESLFESATQDTPPSHAQAPN